MPLGKLVHFRGALTDQFPQRRREGDWGAPPGFPVIQGTLCHFAAEHLFQTHGLCTQLHFVGLMFLGPAAFILHGEDAPSSGFPVEGNALVRLLEYHHIALPRQAQGMGDHGQAPHHQGVPSAFPQGGVMGPLVKEGAFHGEKAFLPLLL